MPPYTILEQLPDVADYNRLRVVVGWGAYPVEVAEPCLARSLYGVCALLDDVVVAMARVIGDGGMTFYIQDVIVHPDHQGRGLGAQLMDRVMAYLGAHAVPGAVVGLMAAAGKEGFYERYGFTRRPTERLGAGMTRFW